MRTLEHVGRPYQLGQRVPSGATASHGPDCVEPDPDRITDPRQINVYELWNRRNDTIATVEERRCRCGPRPFGDVIRTIVVHVRPDTEQPPTTEERRAAAARLTQGAA